MYTSKDIDIDIFAGLKQAIKNEPDLDKIADEIKNSDDPMATLFVALGKHNPDHDGPLVIHFGDECALEFNAPHGAGVYSSDGSYRPFDEDEYVGDVLVDATPAPKRDSTKYGRSEHAVYHDMLMTYPYTPQLMPRTDRSVLPVSFYARKSSKGRWKKARKVR